MIWLDEDLLSVVEPTQAAEQNLQAYPNPFSQQISFEFSLNAAQHVKLDVFDLRGRKVISLLDAMKTSGSHTVIWDGSGENASLVPGGVYLVRMIAGNDVSTKKILLNP
jgi:flagellar hook assembly protein FlgD